MLQDVYGRLECGILGHLWLVDNRHCARELFAQFGQCSSGRKWGMLMHRANFWYRNQNATEAQMVHLNCGKETMCTRLVYRNICKVVPLSFS